MAVGFAKGAYNVYVYDPKVKKKRYVGRFSTEEEARAAELEHKLLVGGKHPDARKCPGCREPFVPDDQWQKRCSLRCEQNVKRRERRWRERRNDDHWVYTAVNADGEVIYVGVTSTGLRRHKEHGREMAWWPEVATMRIEHFATREEALAGERAGIALYRPRFNTFLVGVEAA